MLFNSLAFAFFLPIVFILYWVAAKRNLHWQNIMLLVASYFFYTCWDWRFVFLLMFSTLLDYVSAIKIVTAKNKAQEKMWFWLSIVINAGFLGIFKYYNFFITSFSEAAASAGLHIHPVIIRLILPVGISFYTFHGLSYIIDVYKRRIEPEKNIIDYSLFVSFFPLLVAGPIERATHLLPQIKQQRHFKYSNAIDGLKQIVWGLFKKMVIADNCAQYANLVFQNYDQYNASSLVIGVLFFTFQIYGDFSGYSDIAIGSARLLGFDLLRNFAFPYFSRDMAEFWRRWHISLSSWFRDYLYIPLGGSRASKSKKVRNVLIIFLVSGFWHGAGWTFIFWGLLNAVYIIPIVLSGKNRTNIDMVAENSNLPTLKEFGQMIITFGLTAFAWIFFRSATIRDASRYIKKIFSPTLLNQPDFPGVKQATVIFVLIACFMIIEWIGRRGRYGLQNIGRSWHRVPRWSFYAGIIFLIALFMQTNETPFIYFQF